MKILNGFMTVYWLFQFIFGVIAIYNKETISPITSLGAMLICAIYFFSMFKRY